MPPWEPLEAPEAVLTPSPAKKRLRIGFQTFLNHLEQEQGSSNL
jgi:hypothetical protein